MTKKKYLSNKKTAQQTISISLALKEWIKRYVNVQHREDPKDERFKSISSFYNNVMGNVLRIFEKSKTLDDFERVEDKEVRDFFEPFTFNATIPLYEMVSENNRFTPLFQVLLLNLQLDFYFDIQIGYGKISKPKIFKA